MQNQCQPCPEPSMALRPLRLLSYLALENKKRASSEWQTKAPFYRAHWEPKHAFQQPRISLRCPQRSVGVVSVLTGWAWRTLPVRHPEMINLGATGWMFIEQD